MPGSNYNVKVTVDVQGRKIMDELAKGAGTKDSAKSLGGAVGSAAGDIMKGKDIGATFQTLIGSITPLTAVLGVGVGILAIGLANSKIFNRVLGTVGKLLGYLVDIILLPMMPFFILLVRYMYQMLTAFRNFTRNLTGEGAIKFLIDISLLANPLLWPVLLVKKLIENKESLGAVIPFTVDILKGTGDWLWSIAEWIFGAAVTVPGKIIDLALSIGSMISGALGGVVDLALSILKWVFGLGSMPLNSRVVINFVANLVGSGWSVVKSLARSGMSMITSALKSVGLPTLDTGGTVMGTGLAVVHKGETYSGVNASGKALGKGNLTVQITGQFKSEEEMYRKFVDRLRQDRWTSAL